MKGFHSIWSKPYLEGHNTDEYFLQDYEILTMMLSALMWRKNNGGIMLLADKLAKEYIEKLGIAHIWDLGIQEFQVPESICSKVFWAAGKLFAMQKVTMPAVMVDLDLIIWQNIKDILKDTEICAIHREGIYPDIYPDKDFFNMKPEYEFNPNLNWDVFPVNTCMLYIKDDEFKKFYTEESIRFMEGAAEQDENLCHMVFAEQRMLGMCADICGKEVDTFFPGSTDIENQNIFTHLWGFKNIMKFNYQEREAFNKKLADRIIREFPEEEPVVRRLMADLSPNM